MADPQSAEKLAETSPAPFWAQVRALLDWALAVLGAASDIARLQLVASPRRVEILSWLRPLERLARLGLMEMALALPAPATVPPRVAGARARSLAALDPDKPETWPARFALLAQSKRAASTNLPIQGANRPGSALTGSGVFRAWPLAARMEAVRRVTENPEPYARRLRRALEARPERAMALARGSPPRRRPDAPHGPADFLIEEAELAVMGAVMRWDSS